MLLESDSGSKRVYEEEKLKVKKNKAPRPSIIYEIKIIIFKDFRSR